MDNPTTFYVSLPYKKELFCYRCTANIDNQEMIVNLSNIILLLMKIQLSQNPDVYAPEDFSQEFYRAVNTLYFCEMRLISRTNLNDL